MICAISIFYSYNIETYNIFKAIMLQYIRVSSNRSLSFLPKFYNIRGRVDGGELLFNEMYINIFFQLRLDKNEISSSIVGILYKKKVK